MAGCWFVSEETQRLGTFSRNCKYITQLVVAQQRLIQFRVVTSRCRLNDCEALYNSECAKCLAFFTSCSSCWTYQMYQIFLFGDFLAARNSDETWWTADVGKHKTERSHSILIREKQKCPLEDSKIKSQLGSGNIKLRQTFKAVWIHFVEYRNS